MKGRAKGQASSDCPSPRLKGPSAWNARLHVAFKKRRVTRPHYPAALCESCSSPTTRRCSNWHLAFQRWQCETAYCSEKCEVYDMRAHFARTGGRCGVKNPATGYCVVCEEITMRLEPALDQWRCVKHPAAPFEAACPLPPVEAFVPPTFCLTCSSSLDGLSPQLRQWHVSRCVGAAADAEAIAAMALLQLHDGHFCPVPSILSVGASTSLGHPLSLSGACADAPHPLSSHDPSAPLSSVMLDPSLTLRHSPSGAGRLLIERAAWKAIHGVGTAIRCDCGGCAGCCANLFLAVVQLKVAELVSSLHSYDWPITDRGELLRLLVDPIISPSHLMGGEFTASMRRSFDRRGRRSLSVDLRDCDLKGMHFRGDLRLVIAASVEVDHRWAIAFFWPPCTQQVLSDEFCLPHKIRDGRAFFGVAFFLLCYTFSHADCVVVEQPDTLIPDVYLAPTHRIMPTDFGDSYAKPIHLYVRGAHPLPPPHVAQRATKVLRRRRISSFADADERDRWRSSWAEYPLMVEPLASWLETTRSATSLDFKDEISRLASNWAALGLPLPTGYSDSWARPPDAAYQFTRGSGDGRRRHAPQPPRDASLIRPSYMPWVPTLPVEAGARVLHLCFVARAVTPLVLAATSNTRLIGVALPAGSSSSGEALLAAAGRLVAAARLATAPMAYLAGRNLDGSGVVVIPFGETTPRCLTAGRPTARAALAAAGVGLAWATLLALRHSPALEAATLAVQSVMAFAEPQFKGMGLDGRVLGTQSFSVGAGAMRQLAAAAPIPEVLSIPRDVALAKSLADMRWLAARLLGYSGPLAEDIHLWADRLQPPPLGRVPDALLETLGDESDPRVAQVPFDPIVAPLITSWLPRRPSQPPRDECPQHVFDLLTPLARLRLRAWLGRELEHARCVERQSRGEACSARRPPPLAMGRASMLPFAVDVVWDFTFERSKSCGVPLDFGIPIESDLNLPYLVRRLRDYPDQRLVSYIAEGVRFEADVEYNSVFCSSLISLPKGFASVRQELRRLHGRGWYRYFAHIPFWPFRANAQGAVARKLEPDRWRRTTDGGSPRQFTVDEEGVRAISVNEASRLEYQSSWSRRLASSDPTWEAWLQRRGSTWSPELNPGIERRRSESATSKWPPQRMPTPDAVMRDLVVLRRAASLLGEPLYVFCDDAADFFSQLSLAPEEWHLMGVIFLRGDEDHERIEHPPPHGSTEPGELVFISERRLGFGTHPASNIAQRFSEALLHLFRTDMDKVEDAIMEADPRPSMEQWRRERQEVQARHGGHQARLYASTIYCDDPIHACVGIERCVRMLRTWRRLTTDAGLLMAIPEKRMLGVWLSWLGILIFAGLGFVVIPPEKIMRAVMSINRALAGAEEFSAYRALVGLLEHIRAITRLPRAVMYYLYDPHMGDPEPNGLVRLNESGAARLRWWRGQLGRIGGAPFTRALGWKHLPPRACFPQFVIYSDAASEGAGAGLGGFCNGMYWYLPLTEKHLHHLHITALELLAIGIGALTFAPYLPPEAHVVLLSDASTAVGVLASHSARSATLRTIHTMLLAHPTFAELSGRAACTHISGLANVAADLASRGQLPRLLLLCAQAKIRAEHIPVHPEGADLLQRATEWAEARGLSVRPPPAFISQPRRRTMDALDLAVETAIGQGFEGGDPPASVSLAVPAPR